MFGVHQLKECNSLYKWATLSQKVTFIQLNVYVASYDVAVWTFSVIYWQQRRKFGGWIEEFNLICQITNQWFAILVTNSTYIRVKFIQEWFDLHISSDLTKLRVRPVPTMLVCTWSTLYLLLVNRTSLIALKFNRTILRDNR